MDVQALIADYTARGCQYEDPAFPLSFPVPAALRGRVSIKWARPSGYQVGAVLEKDGFQASDLRQGLIGDCWLLAAISVAASTPGTLQQVFLTHTLNAAGIVAARFWMFGGWTTVVTDDR